MASITDAAKEVVDAEFDKRRSEIDSGQPLDTISIIIQVQDGRVLNIDFRSSGRRVISGRRSRA